MRKKTWIITSVITLLVIGAGMITVHQLKPGEKAYHIWLENEYDGYDVKCTDDLTHCDRIDLTITDVGSERTSSFLSARGYTRNGWFVQEFRRQYYNNETDEYFTIEVRGFLGEFHVVETDTRFNPNL